jgi:hypothetical protein
MFTLFMGSLVWLARQSGQIESLETTIATHVLLTQADHAKLVTERDDAVAEIAKLQAKLPIFAVFGAQLDLYASVDLSNPETAKVKPVTLGDCEAETGCYRFRYQGIMSSCESDCYHLSAANPGVKPGPPTVPAAVFNLDFGETPGMGFQATRFGLPLRRECSAVAQRSRDEMVIAIEDTRIDSLRIGVFVRPRQTPRHPDAPDIPIVFPECAAWISGGSLEIRK